MIKKLSIYLLFFNTCILKSQLPNCDLWLFKIESNKEGLLFKDPVNITMRDGYDNQPSFYDDGKKIIYVSIREDKQADLYYYDLKKKKNIQLTKTTVSEYSPVETTDGNFFGSVVVENDSAQRIHFIDKISGIHEKKFDFDSVGYYSFLNADTIIYYKLTEPHSLRYFVKGSQADKWLGMYPIRGFKATSRNTLVYGLKDSTKVVFYKYNFILHKAEKYTEYPSLNEDITWHPTLGLVKSEGSRLLRFDEQKKEWILLTDLSFAGLKKITRFCFDPKNKYLVVVDNL